MTLRKSVLIAALSAAFTLSSFPAFSDVYVDTNPPPRKSEKYEKREGYVWAPGSWQWRNGKHEWVEGRYIPEKKGHRWEPDRWVQHDNNKWTYQRGGWSRENY